MIKTIMRQPTFDSTLLSNFEPDLQNKLISVFFTQATTIIDEIKQYLKKENLSDLTKKAHLLKGSCLALGTSRMAAICDILQNKGAEKDKPTIKKLVSLLEKDFQLAKKALEKVRQQND